MVSYLNSLLFLLGPPKRSARSHLINDIGVETKLNMAIYLQGVGGGLRVRAGGSAVDLKARLCGGG